MIYLDNAATTLQKPQQVIDAVVEAMSSAGNASRGTHDTSLAASRTVCGARIRLARMFCCPRADHVVFTANSTEALNIALCGLLSEGDHVITTDLEHNSVLRPLFRLTEENKVEVSFVRADTAGKIRYEEFQHLIRPSTRAIVCTHASNLTGDLVDIGRIGALAKAAGLLFIVDASQTAGIFPIDMGKMGISVLCFTGHKGLMGPQGTGGLCVAPGIDIRPFCVGGTGVQSYSPRQPQEMPARLEAGTLNAHGLAGLAAAADYISGVGMERIRQKESQLMRRFYEGVSKLRGVRIYGDFSQKERAAIVSINIEGYDSAAAADDLAQLYGIATRPGAHCAPRLHEALGTAECGAVRFSFSWFTRKEEVDAAIHAVKELAQVYR